MRPEMAMFTDKVKVASNKAPSIYYNLWDVHLKWGGGGIVGSD